MGIRKKILFVSDIDLSKFNHAGNKNALLSLASYLGENNEISLLNLHRNKPSPDCFSNVIHVPRYLNAIKRRVFRILGIPQKMISYKSSVFLSFITKILDVIYEYDYIFVEYLELYSAVRFIDYNKRVCDLHDLMHLRKQSFLKGGLAISAGLNVNFKEEAKLVNVFSKVLVIQEKEYEHLKSMGINSELILAKRAALNSKYHMPHCGSKGHDYFHLGFIGNSADFNIDALSYIYEVLWPALSGHKRIKLYVAGSVGKKISDNLPNGVEYMGFVDDLADFYGNIDLLINPIRFGSGLKTKNIESFSYGVPVLTTYCGAEGMESMLGRGLDIFYDECEFVKKIEKISSSKISNIDIKMAYEELFGAKVCYKALEDSLYGI
ncbi:glycosyltransferase [Vibrio metschnikovii]|uniref:glycosyltransferase n=1 Tax=Vibrio metschnikovii TaxID=28172 RepID=UPI001C2F6E73|nr:glycosyltransferase [Vibrio metschnikovii]